MLKKNEESWCVEAAKSSPALLQEGRIAERRAGRGARMSQCYLLSLFFFQLLFLQCSQYGNPPCFSTSTRFSLSVYVYVSAYGLHWSSAVQDTW